jgi:hypothetical protein
MAICILTDFKIKNNNKKTKKRTFFWSFEFDLTDKIIWGILETDVSETIAISCDFPINILVVCSELKLERKP